MKRLPEIAIANAYLDGSTIRTLAREAGVSDAVLRRTLTDAGVRIRRAVRGAPPPADINAVVADYLAGDSLDTVAARHGIHASTVRVWVLRCGHAMRSCVRRPITPETEAAIMAARFREPGHLVARRLGVAPMTVYRRWHGRRNR